MEAAFTGKEITKELFFLIIDADDFKITAGVKQNEKRTAPLSRRRTCY